MTTINLSPEAYFQAFPLTSVWGGGEFDVFVSEFVVVKELSLGKLDRGMLMNLPRADLAEGPRAAVIKSQRMAGKLRQLKSDQLYTIKDRLGGWVVPFERPQEICCRIRRMCGLWKEKRKFFRPVVQHCVPKENRLDRRLRSLREAGDFSAVEVLLEGAFRTMKGLVKGGFFPHDNVPANFALFDGSVMLLDLGAVWKLGKNVQGALAGDDEVRQTYVARNGCQWEKAIRGDIPEGESPELDNIMRRFEIQFDLFNQWRTIARLKKQRGNLRSVPDVFPLPIESKPLFYQAT